LHLNEKGYTANGSERHVLGISGRKGQRCTSSLLRDSPNPLSLDIDYFFTTQVRSLPEGVKEFLDKLLKGFRLNYRSGSIQAANFSAFATPVQSLLYPALKRGWCTRMLKAESH